MAEKRTLKERSGGVQELMHQLYLIYAGYWLLDDYQTFYENMNEEQIRFFVTQGRLDNLQETFNAAIFKVGMAAREVVEGFDFMDDELLTVLGKKSTKTEDEMYAEILRVVRLNPINQKVVP